MTSSRRGPRCCGSTPSWSRASTPSCSASLAWYDVLLELNAAPEQQLRMFDLGEAVVLSRTRVSRVVDDLVGAGYVERVPNPIDRRSAFARLTPAGRKAFRKAAPLYLDLIRRHFGSRLDRGDAKTLRNLLYKIVTAGPDG